MREYTFQTPCSLQDMKARLIGQVALVNDRYNGAVKLKLSWRSEMEFDLGAVFTEKVEGVFANQGTDHVSGSLHSGKGWNVSETFRGEIVPDDEGGSAVRGYFRLWGISTKFMTGFGALALLIGIAVPTPFETALAMGLLGWNLYRHWRRIDIYPASQWLLDFLENCVKTST